MSLDRDDLGHPVVGKALVSLVLFRCIGAVFVFGLSIREHGLLATAPWTVAVLVLVVALNVAALVLLRDGRRALLAHPGVVVADIAVAVAVNVWAGALAARGTYLTPYQDPMSIYLTGTVTLWAFLMGGVAGLWGAGVGLAAHWATGLVNGYGAGALANGVLYERWVWLLLGVVGATLVSRGVADGLRAEHRARLASCRAAQGEAEARILREAHGGVLPTLASIRHLLGAEGDRGEQTAAVLGLVHDCEATVRRRLVEWNGGWSEVRTAVEDEIERLRKRRQLAGESAVHIEVVEVGAMPALEPFVAGALVEAVGEAVRNAVRHASATRVVVKLRSTGGWLSAVVRDDGCGFTHTREGFGIRHSIRNPLEAVGGSAVRSGGPGEGTRWELRVPVLAAGRARGGLGTTTHSRLWAALAR
ncbi:MAG: sensor histidine kinase [Egibacteraceae bacterium]